MRALAMVALACLAGCTLQYTDENASKGEAARPASTASASSSAGASTTAGSSSGSTTSTTTSTGTTAASIATTGTTASTASTGTNTSTTNATTGTSTSTTTTSSTSTTGTSGLPGSTQVLVNAQSSGICDVVPLGNNQFLLLDSDPSDDAPLQLLQLPSGALGPAVDNLAFGSSLALMNDGGVYVSETDANTNDVRFVDWINALESQTAIGEMSIGSTDGSFGTARFNAPGGIAFDPLGNLVVADTGNNEIRYIDFNTFQVSTIAGDTTAAEHNGPIGTAQFNDPVALAVDSNGNIFVADQGSGGWIRMIDAAHTQVSVIAGNGTTNVVTSPGLATASGFGTVRGIAVGADGTVYVADANVGIRVIAGGQMSTIDLSATTSGDNDINFVRVESPTTLLTADTSGNVVRVMLP